MKILCVNWQAADEAELEREHYPDIEFILARSTNDKAATLDPAACETSDAVINYSPTHNVAAAPSAFPKARIAVRSGVGFDNIDTSGWGARRIPACNVPDYGTTEVADHAIGLMLALTRGTSTYGAELSGHGAEGWHFSKAPLVRRHKGATFGIVGLGRIGLATARRAAAFDMKVVFYDPHLLSGVDLSTGYERVHSLAELMGRADVVSVHAPLSEETRKLLGAATFAAARPGLVLINTARGPIVDLDALETAMRNGTVSGAGLDVLPNEPGDLDHPLLAAWRNREPWIANRLIVTPHAAFYSPASMRDLRLKSIEVVHAYLAEGRLTNCVNSEYLK
ncbi:MULTISPECIES: C-terminal binding protein [unclassified Mesorhizobium]|uniref:C-terminal binding protein n=2 Tax=Mesorhizobium TaxID=68287 RepID=UPI000FE894F7|nr:MULTISPECIES: C-terminal binding protein [unclassified Mesorhizobium]TGV52461.1 C-terminal binding protein [bacterium M00.F.Ca.ET.141.01.1.1]RWF47279.1 MAG: C-terminal binding protein [Mesorhizobium sp.]TGS40857.1 C-terminal binding protein [Mesorhizobium sp. M8A.F.Ca.ET.182.01.1.1]TGS78968.1 C-terminal binding protein [Mesorhizobium sp. M8A.F.Ca.ET.181.01.1.1]TGT36167.1 C-terminal binding protein [Mesorhizobium sp. M8A.F.Ca.ET.165.01.1.1]